MNKIIIVTILFISLQNKSQAQRITKIDPPNWWQAMQNDTLQLLVYGNNIGNMQVKTRTNDAQIISVNNENQDYLIVYLKLAKTIAANYIQLEFYNKNKTINYNYPILPNLKNWQPIGFNNADVVYLLMPDRWANGAKKNDHIEDMEQTDIAKIDGRHGGDLQGMMQHLDYLKDLGVTTIWPTPVQEMNQAKGSYHQYGMSNFYAIDPRFGLGNVADSINNNLYKQFVTEAHNKNLKVIMDVVMNHIGYDHYWMQHTPRIKNWVHDSTICNFDMPAITDPHASNQDIESMEKGWFVPSMPDLNQNNKDLANYMIQNTIWWINFAHLDAVRLDTAPFSEKNFLTKWSKTLKNEFPTLGIVAEVWSENNHPSDIGYWQQNPKNIDGYNSGLESVMDLPLFETLTTAIRDNNARKVYMHITHDNAIPDADANFILLGNHDTERFFTTINENENKYKLGMMMLATLRGTPQLYYGDELLYTGKKGINDGLMRADMQFEKYNQKQQDALLFTKQLLAWRKTCEVVNGGKMIHYLPQNNVYVYARIKNNKSILVLCNFDNKPQQLSTSRFEEVTKKQLPTSIMSSKNVGHPTLLNNINWTKPTAAIKDVTLDPYECIIIAF
jgi:neopullulanase